MNEDTKSRIAFLLNKTNYAQNHKQFIKAFAQNSVPANQAQTSQASATQQKSLQEIKQPCQQVPSCQILEVVNRREELKDNRVVKIFGSVGKQYCFLYCTQCKIRARSYKVEMREEERIVYRCKKCRSRQVKEKKAEIKFKKMATKSLEKRRRNEQKLNDPGKIKKKVIPPTMTEWQKRISEFQGKYPCYLQNKSKFKYPMPDSLLLVYHELFGEEKKIIQPEEDPLISPSALGDFLTILNFALTFQQQIEFDIPINKHFFYNSFKLQGPDLVFHTLLKRILQLYLNQVIQNHRRSNKHSLKHNSFFFLMSYLRDSQLTLFIIPDIWQDICQHLKDIPTLEKAFEYFVMPTDVDSFANKLYILRVLIEGLADVEMFRVVVEGKSQRLRRMTNQRMQLGGEVRKWEVEIVQIGERMKEIQGEAKIIELEIREQEQKGKSTLQSQARLVQVRNPSSELRSRVSSLISLIDETKARIKQLDHQIIFCMNSLQLIGRDRNESQYFLLETQPDTLYVRSKKGISDTSQNFKVLKGKDKILDFAESLNLNGIKEKALNQNILNMIQEGIICSSLQESEMPIEQNQYQFEFSKLDLNISFIKRTFLDIESKFSSYLNSKGMRWADQTVRQSQRLAFESIEDFTELKYKIIDLLRTFSCYQVQSKTSQKLNSQSQISEGEKATEVKKRPFLTWARQFTLYRQTWIHYVSRCLRLSALWMGVFFLKNFIDAFVLKSQRIDQRRKARVQEQIRSLKDSILEEEEEKELELQEINKEQNKQIKPKKQKNSKKPKKQQQQSKNLTNFKNLRVKQSESQDSESLYFEKEKECQICEQIIGNSMQCSQCPKKYHRRCLKLRIPPPQKWVCPSCLVVEQNKDKRQTRSRSHVPCPPK